jgi:hypothetical protein
LSKIALIYGCKYNGFADAVVGFDSLVPKGGPDRVSRSETRATAIGTARPRHLDALTSVRAVFALMVVFHHFVGYHG